MDPARPHPPASRSAIALARALPAIELARAATRALNDRDDIVAMAVAQEAARRIGAAPPGDAWLAEARRIAADMEWNGGERGPLFEQARERLGLLSPEGRVLFVGREAAGSLGVPPERVVGLRIADAFPGVAALLEGELKRVSTGGIAKGEGWFEVHGRRAHASWVIVPVWSGGRVVAALLMGADTTASREDDGSPAIRLA